MIDYEKLFDKLNNINVRFYYKDVDEKEDMEFCIAFMCECGCFQMNLGYTDVVKNAIIKIESFDILEHNKIANEYRKVPISQSEEVEKKLKQIKEILLTNKF